MPTTPVYGFPFEDENDQPGITLTGGEAGTEAILAEEIETEVERIDTDLSDVQGRVTTIEEVGILGWTYINHGVNSGTGFTVDLTRGGALPIGAFDMIRLHMRFDLDDEGFVLLRINNDSSDIYRHGTLIYDALGNLDDAFHNVGPGSNGWRIGYGATVSTNNLTCQLFHTNGDVLVSYQSISTRQSDDPNAHKWGQHWGSLVTQVGAAPSSLRVMTVGSVSYTNAWWWVEGFRTP